MFQNEFSLADNLDLLIKGCLHRDRPSQAKLYQHLAPRMMGVCLWYARSKEEAEEILHDGFMRVFTYLHTYNGIGPFEGWVRKIMVNAALIKFRNKSSIMYKVAEFSTEDHDLVEDADFIYQYDEKKLLALIQLLPPACRMVFNLYVFEGYKHREISKMLNITDGTSKSNLADARRILKAALTKTKKIVSF